MVGPSPAARTVVSSVQDPAVSCSAPHPRDRPGLGLGSQNPGRGRRQPALEGLLERLPGRLPEAPSLLWGGWPCAWRPVQTGRPAMVLGEGLLEDSTSAALAAGWAPAEYPVSGTQAWAVGAVGLGVLRGI